MPVPCARCNTSLPEWELAANGAAVCTACGVRNQARVFPAALRVSAPASAEVALDGEAACFDHPGKRAVAACGQCGRFLCQLCAVDCGGTTWCPSCVAVGAGAAKAARLDASRTLYDSIALITPLASWIFWPLTLITGPAAVVLSMLKWNAPRSLVRRSRWRFVAGSLVGLAETCAWIWGVVYVLAYIGRRS